MEMKNQFARKGDTVSELVNIFFKFELKEADSC